MAFYLHTCSIFVNTNNSSSDINKHFEQFDFLENQKRAQQLGITLIVSDALFLLVRLPNFMSFAFNSNLSNTFIFNILVSIFTIFGALHSALSFILFLILNKFYRDLFIKLMKKIKRYFKNQQSSGCNLKIFINFFWLLFK